MFKSDSFLFWDSWIAMGRQGPLLLSQRLWTLLGTLRGVYVLYNLVAMFVLLVAMYYCMCHSLWIDVCVYVCMCVWSCVCNCKYSSLVTQFTATWIHWNLKWSNLFMYKSISGNQKFWFLIVFISKHKSKWLELSSVNS